MKVPFVIYVGTESLKNTYFNNPKMSSTTKSKQTYCMWLFIIYTLFI